MQLEVQYDKQFHNENLITATMQRPTRLRRHGRVRSVADQDTTVLL